MSYIHVLCGKPTYYVHVLYQTKSTIQPLCQVVEQVAELVIYDLHVGQIIEHAYVTLRV